MIFQNKVRIIPDYLYLTYAIIIFYRFDQVTDANSCVELFLYFSCKGLLWGFTGLNFSARELPLSLKFSITSRRGKY